jgi:hypothetical protein
VNVETTEQSKQWMHTHSPNKAKKFKLILSARKLIAAVFWGRKGVLMVEFMQHEITVTSEAYCETLKKKKNCVVLAIESKMRGNADVRCSAPP